VNLLRKTLVLGMVTFWTLVTSHCGLETISGLEFLACTPASETAPHPPSDCGDGNDACTLVESGHYRVEERQITTAQVPGAAVSFALAIFSNLVVLESTAGLVSPEPPPPELARGWQFTFRAALPPRAPSLIS
jgi:hypothetical protein